jgi:hypothetical protein
MLTLLSILSASPAHAAACDALVGKLDGLAPEDVAGAWTELSKCDRKPATVNFNRYVAKAGNTEAVAALLVAAARQDTFEPAWNALELIKDYDQRDEVAAAVGAACATEPKVVEFLRGAFDRKPNTYKQWDDGWRACDSEGLWTFAAQKVAEPPASTYDETYDILLGIYVRRQKAAGLPTLAGAAVKAAGNGGPFETLIAKMGEAATPEVGESQSDEARKAYTDALTDVGRKVKGANVARVASALAANGADGAAASFLPSIYADRVQKGGTFLYGAAAIESGTCGGAKTAVVHVATATEPGKRWTIDADLEKAFAGMKTKLGKDCEANPLVVVHSPEPVKNADDASTWQEGVVKKWEGDGFSVKTQKEKAVTLP